jgi:hypothetical protein
MSMTGPMSATPLSPKSATKCPHCRHETETGTRGGCSECRLVKHTADGRIPPKKEEGV